jgi:hypothetical protein
MRVANAIPFGCSLLLPVGIVHSVQTLKGNMWFWNGNGRDGGIVEKDEGGVGCDAKLFIVNNLHDSGIALYSKWKYQEEAEPVYVAWIAPRQSGSVVAHPICGSWNTEWEARTTPLTTDVAPVNGGSMVGGDDVKDDTVAWRATLRAKERRLDANAIVRIDAPVGVAVGVLERQPRPKRVKRTENSKSKPKSNAKSKKAKQKEEEETKKAKINQANPNTPINDGPINDSPINDSPKKPNTRKAKTTNPKATKTVTAPSKPGSDGVEQMITDHPKLALEMEAKIREALGKSKVTAEKKPTQATEDPVDAAKEEAEWGKYVDDL